MRLWMSSRASRRWAVNEALPDGDESDVPAPETITDHTMRKFMDSLEGHDLAADIYLPIEFDGSFELGSFRFGSLNVLIDVLEELRDELDLDADDDEDEAEDDDDIDDDDDDADKQLKDVWASIAKAAQEALDRGLPLHVKSA